MNIINRNVSIVTVILVLVVIAGYLVWLRSRVQNSVSPAINVEQVQTPTPSASASAQLATPSGKEATGSMKEKAATSTSTKK